MKRRSRRSVCNGYSGGGGGGNDDEHYDGDTHDTLEQQLLQDLVKGSG